MSSGRPTGLRGRGKRNEEQNLKKKHTRRDKNHRYASHSVRGECENNREIISFASSLKLNYRTAKYRWLGVWSVDSLNLIVRCRARQPPCTLGMVVMACMERGMVDLIYIYIYKIRFSSQHNVFWDFDATDIRALWPFFRILLDFHRALVTSLFRRPARPHGPTPCTRQNRSQ